jgi:hypothetical protein
MIVASPAPPSDRLSPADQYQQLGMRRPQRGFQAHKKHEQKQGSQNDARDRSVERTGISQCDLRSDLCVSPDKYKQDHGDPGATCIQGGNSRCNHYKFQTVKIFRETVVPARMSLKSEDEIKQRVCVLPGPAD